MLEICNLSAEAGKKPILKQINIELVPHTLTTVIGKNGSGKSTLVSCVNQTFPYTGEILFRGRNLKLIPPRERATLISILPQILTTPHIKVEELIKMGRTPYLDIGHHFTENDRKAVAEAFAVTGMEELSQCYIDELSGGERQRAYLAMVFAQQTRLMILDEPATYMDMSYEQRFMETLGVMKNRHKKTLLVIMHNLNAAVRFADRIVIMSDGEALFEGTKEACLDSGLIEKTFGVKRYNTADRIFFSA